MMTWNDTDLIDYCMGDVYSRSCTGDWRKVYVNDVNKFELTLDHKYIESLHDISASHLEVLGSSRELTSKCREDFQL